MTQLVKRRHKSTIMLIPFNWEQKLQEVGMPGITIRKKNVTMATFIVKLKKVIVYLATPVLNITGTSQPSISGWFLTLIQHVERFLHLVISQIQGAGRHE